MLRNARLRDKARYLQLHETTSFPVGKLVVVTYEMWPEGTLLAKKEQLIFCYSGRLSICCSTMPSKFLPVLCQPVSWCSLLSR